jgi:hypothetical protein
MEHKAMEGFLGFLIALIAIIAAPWIATTILRILAPKHVCDRLIHGYKKEDKE